MAETRRVVVTGIGLVTPAGVGAVATWRAVAAGQSAIGPITLFDASALPTRIAAQVRDFDPRDHVPNRKLLKLLTRADAFGLAAAGEAVRAARLVEAKLDPLRCGVYVGCGKEIPPPDQALPAVLACIDDDGYLDTARFGAVGMREVYPLTALQNLPNAGLYYISSTYGLKGVNANLSGETAGALAVGEAYRAIQSGDADLVLAAGFDAPIDPQVLMGYTLLGRTSRRNADPVTACCPFDQARDGTVLGEGAAAVVLEAADHALSRGVDPLAEIVGYGSAIETEEWPQGDQNGMALARAVEAALQEMGTDAGDVNLIIAHGDGTQQGDTAEATGLQKALGDELAALPVTALKPTIGHLGCAAGVAEFALAVMALQAEWIPPTANHITPDPACSLPIVVDGRSAYLDHVLCINRGWSGQNVVLRVCQAGKGRAGDERDAGDHL